jgi:chromatin assembly factor 1 subunit A
VSAPYPVTVNPFSTEYWETASTRTSAAPGSLSLAVQSSAFKRPALVDKTKSVNGVNSIAPHPAKVTRLVPAEDLEAFKAAINGQDLTKIAMIEHLKKQYVISIHLC